MSKFSFWRSLRLRLFVIIFLIGLIPSVMVYTGILGSYEKRAVKVRSLDIQNQLTILSNHLITYNYMSDVTSPVVNAELNLLANLYNGRVVIIDNNLKVIKDTYGISEGKTFVTEEVINCLKGVNTTNYDDVNDFIEITIPIIETVSDPSDNPDFPPGAEIYRGVLLTVASTDTIVNTMSVMRTRAGIIELIMLIIVLVTSIITSRLLVKPFNKVSNEITDMVDMNIYKNIELPDYQETEPLVGALNRLMTQMSTVDESRKKFVSNVSHELKTPMTSVKVLADSLLAQPDAPAELYREFMSDIAEEIERENGIINDLLTLVKLDQDAAALNVATVDIVGMVEIILKRLRPIARKSDVELTLVSLREVEAQADDVKLTLAITNLVENAIKYNKPHGTVTVTVDADHQNFTIKVKDTGIGIPEEDIEEIFERFYRVDKSHSTLIGGTGLGLSIAKSAVIMHRGSIKVESKIDEGSTFLVTVPLKQPN